MKQFLSLLLALTLLLAMAACGKKNDDSTGSGTQNGGTQNGGQNDTQTGDQTVDYGALGLTLMNSETLGKLRVGMTEAELIAELGEPASSTTPSMWTQDSMNHRDLTYTKEGITVNMAEKDGAYTVYSITADNTSTLTTSKGVKIGTPIDEAILSYSTYYNEELSDPSMVLLGTAGGGVTLMMENGMVTGIYIGGPKNSDTTSKSGSMSGSSGSSGMTGSGSTGKSGASGSGSTSGGSGKMGSVG